MRRLCATFFLAAVLAGGVGCQNIARIGCETKHFYLDLQRVVFGIDYPHGAPESSRQKYYGIPSAAHISACDE